MRLRYGPATAQVFDPTGTGESAVLGPDAALMYAAEPPVADAAPLAQACCCGGRCCCCGGRCCCEGSFVARAGLADDHMAIPL